MWARQHADQHQPDRTRRAQLQTASAARPAVGTWRTACDRVRAILAGPSRGGNAKVMNGPPTAPVDLVGSRRSLGVRSVVIVAASSQIRRALLQTGRGQNPAPSLLPPVTCDDSVDPFTDLDHQSSDLERYEAVQRRSRTLSAVVSANVRQARDRQRYEVHQVRPDRSQPMPAVRSRSAPLGPTLCSQSAPPPTTTDHPRHRCLQFWPQALVRPSNKAGPP